MNADEPPGASPDNQLSIFEVDEAMQPLVESIAIGLDESLERQLIEKSRQPAILEHTPNDSQRRFGDPAMFRQWLAQGRELHWLLSPDRDLAGIIWYEPSTFPLDIAMPELPQETFAIRIYDGYNGHGLARPFMKRSLQLHVGRKKERGEPVSGIWLQTDVINPAAIAAYTKFGYKEVDRDEKRITMMLTAAAVAQLATDSPAGLEHKTS